MYALNWLVAWIELFQSTKNSKNVGAIERLLDCYVASERIQNLTEAWNAASILDGTTPGVRSKSSPSNSMPGASARHP